MSLKIGDLEDKRMVAIMNMSERKEKILIEEDKGYSQIWANPDYLYIKGLEVNVFSAMLCIYDNENKDYKAEMSLFIFYDSKTGEKLYSEGGSTLPVCILNFCTHCKTRLDKDEVNNFECRYFLDNGKFLYDKVVNTKCFEIKGQIEV